MKMNEPYLIVYVKDETMYFAKKIPTEAKSREIFEVGIDEVISDEFDEAAKKLGSTVLGILSLWHKDAFPGWGISSNAEKEQNGDFDLAMELIGKSVAGKTKTHVQSIELLLRQAAIKTDSVQQFLDESWPSIRTNLENYPG
jgi:hypothetical protein